MFAVTVQSQMDYAKPKGCTALRMKGISFLAKNGFFGGIHHPFPFHLQGLRRCHEHEGTVSEWRQRVQGRLRRRKSPMRAWGTEWTERRRAERSAQSPSETKKSMPVPLAWRIVTCWCGNVRERNSVRYQIRCLGVIVIFWLVVS